MGSGEIVLGVNGAENGVVLEGVHECVHLGVGGAPQCQGSSVVWVLFHTEVLMSDGDSQAVLIWPQLVIPECFFLNYPFVY